MSCIHNVWNCYCKHDEKVLEKPCSPLCKHYCTEKTSIKSILNNADGETCRDILYGNALLLRLLDRGVHKFINKCYPTKNFGLFNMTSHQAETYIDNNMRYLGYNTEMVNNALVSTVNTFKTDSPSCRFRLYSFVGDMLRQPHKDYSDYCSTNFRFVLTLILGYLGKLNTLDIIQCHEPKQYFWSIIKDMKASTVCEALKKTRAYVEESKDSNLAEGMHMVEQWFKKLAKENIAPKELTIADIEKQLGYKIKIVGEEK